MAVIQFTAKRTSRIAAAATERAYRGGTVGNLATAEGWGRRQELEATIAYSKPVTEAEARTQLALVNEIAEAMNDGTATPEQISMARAAFDSALCFLDG